MKRLLELSLSSLLAVAISGVLIAWWRDHVIQTAINTQLAIRNKAYEGNLRRSQRRVQSLTEEYERLEQQLADYQGLQGLWIVAAHYRDGQQLDGHSSRVGEWVRFGGDQVEFGARGLASLGSLLRFSVNPSQQPAEIQFWNGETKAEKGIYQVRGDEAWLCLVHRDAPLPRNFTTEIADGCDLLQLARNRSARQMERAE